MWKLIFISLKFDSLTLKTHFISLWRVSKMHFSCPFCGCQNEGPVSCKWSSGGAGLLQMIIQRGRPLANDHPVSHTFLEQFVLVLYRVSREGVDMDVPPQKIVLSRRSCISHIVPLWLTCPHPFLYFCRASEVTSLFGEGQKHLDTVSQKKIFYQECFQAGLSLDLEVWGWSKVYSKFKTQTRVNI